VQFHVAQDGQAVRFTSHLDELDFVRGAKRDPDGPFSTFSSHAHSRLICCSLLDATLSWLAPHSKSPERDLRTWGCVVERKIIPRQLAPRVEAASECRPHCLLQRNVFSQPLQSAFLARYSMNPRKGGTETPLRIHM
jgi:hypothetical protein